MYGRPSEQDRRSIVIWKTMRQQGPQFPQNPPNNPQGSLAARWYESVQQHRPTEATYDNKATTATTIATKKERRAEQRRSNLRDMFLENQMLMKQAMTHEERITALTDARNNIHTPSISSTRDMDRARRTMMMDDDDDYYETRNNSNDSPRMSVWPPPEMESFNEDTTFQIFDPTQQEQREAPPPRFLDDNIMLEDRDVSSAFDAIRPLRKKEKSGVVRPTPALADAESMPSPQGEKAKSYQHGYMYEERPYGKTPYGEPMVPQQSTPSAYNNPGITSDMPSADSMNISENSITESEQYEQLARTDKPSILSFFQNACGTAMQQFDVNGDNADKPSMWSYLDVNDDLRYYDEESNSSSERQHGRPQRGKSRTSKTPQSSRTQTQSKKSPRQPSSSSSKRMSHSTKPMRQSPRTKRDTRKVHVETAPLKSNSSVAPKKESRNTIHTGRSNTKGQSKSRKSSPDPRMRQRNSFDGQFETKKKASPRFRVTVTSNVKQDSNVQDRSNSQTATTTTTRGRTRREVQKGHNGESAEIRTPRAVTRDGYETTAAFASSNRNHKQRRSKEQFELSTDMENMTMSRRSSTPTRGKRSSSLERNDTSVSPQGYQEDDDGEYRYPLTPDFPMKQSPENNIMGGGHVGNKGVYSPSEDDSGMSKDTRRLKEKLNQVRSRSIKNMERLQQIQRTSRTSNRIPEKLPGSSPRKEPWAPFENSCTSVTTEQAKWFRPTQALTSCAGGGGGEDGDNEEDEPAIKVPVGSGKKHIDRSTEYSSASSVTVSSSTSESPSYRHKKKEISGKKQKGNKDDVPGGDLGSGAQGEFEGHYMYVAYSRFGNDAKDVLQLCEHQSLPVANSRNNEVLVKVMVSWNIRVKEDDEILTAKWYSYFSFLDKSCCVTASDCEIRRGEWDDVHLSPYIIPGTTFVGKIDHSEKRSAFSNFKPGDMVMSLVKFGANARYVVSSKQELVKVPPGVDPDLAACLPDTYLTAFQVLHMNHRYGSTRYRNDSLKGQSILIMNGQSSLSRAIIELSLAAGAEFCYSLVKSRQAQSISKLGGIPLSKDPQDWLTLIGRQVHLIVAVIDDLQTDNVTRDHLKALNDNGLVIVIGQRGVDSSRSIIPNDDVSSCSGGAPGSRLICKSQKYLTRRKSYNVFDSWELDQKQCKRDLEHLVSLLESGRLNPEVLDRIPLSKTAKAQAIVGSKKLSGHIVCKPWLPQTYVPSR